MLLQTIFVLLLSIYNAQCVVMLRGEVVPANGDYSDSLSGSTLTVRIEDISLQDVASVVLSERVIRLNSGRQFPVYFEIVYPKSIIDADGPDRTYAVSARITSANGELLYINDENVHLPSDVDSSSYVSVRVIKIRENSFFDRSVCQLKPEPGMCLAYFEKYYFDAETGSCKTFVYGGCGGNNNRFDSEQECYDNCLAKAFKPDESKGESKDNVACNDEKEVGPCRAAIPRFFFNKASNKCEEFIYGGCRGNGNNFVTQEECANVCEKN